MASATAESVAADRPWTRDAAARADFQVPLGDFQRLMLYWNERLPFHVVDVIELNTAVNASALQSAAADVLFETGIASPQIDFDSGICTYRAQPCEVEVQTIALPSGMTVNDALAAHSTVELRRPFQINTDPLIRLWVLPTESTCHIGMTWQHWMGDGMAAGDLLHRILARACGWPVAPASSLLDWTAADAQAAFSLWFTWRRKLLHFWETVRTVATSSQVAQLRRPQGILPLPQVHFLDLPCDVLQRIRDVGRQHQATVNDVLVAAVARALTAALPRSERRWWQRRLRIGNIVDLRPNGGAALHGKGGLFLGLYNVDCPPDAPERWDELLGIVRNHSQRAKRLRTYFASLGGFRFARKLWPWVPASWRRSVYTNILRLTAVLTNLRYPDTWYAGPAADQVGAYWRSVPMGFMYPLVFAITTLGDRLTMTMSCDSTGPIAEQAPLIKANIEYALASW